jgi:internalin A
MIRDVFNKIHSSFANPEISEWVPVLAILTTHP